MIKGKRLPVEFRLSCLQIELLSSSIAVIPSVFNHTGIFNTAGSLM